jgi:hypothetical protein
MNLFLRRFDNWFLSIDRDSTPTLLCNPHKFIHIIISDDVLRGSVVRNGGLLMSVTNDLVIVCAQHLMSDADDLRAYIIPR